jgi:hypothetical protein
MKVKELIKTLEGCNQDWDILFSSDEELNCLRKEGQVGEDKTAKSYYLYGLDGTELDDNGDGSFDD